MRAGGAAHSALALDAIARDKTEKASDRKVAGVPGADPKTNVECGMSTKVAINGLGRIGRAILKLVIEEPSIELVAVNDLAEAETSPTCFASTRCTGGTPSPWWPTATIWSPAVSCGRCAPATHWTSPGRSWASSSCSNARGAHAA